MSGCCLRSVPEDALEVDVGRNRANGTEGLRDVIEVIPHRSRRCFAVAALDRVRERDVFIEQAVGMMLAVMEGHGQRCPGEEQAELARTRGWFSNR